MLRKDSKKKIRTQVGYEKGKSGPNSADFTACFHSLILPDTISGK
jgi:hypothetical protein